ncbi:MAG: hypothetical protein HWE24_21370 [Oceanospirillaceae bacterium]|nr:hypothetical protein [Oceanospirillaceae bacterium]
MMCWALKRMFFAAPIPKLALPLLLWRSVENAAPVAAWLSFSSQPLQGWSFDLDHFGILAKAELAKQLTCSIGNQENT